MSPARHIVLRSPIPSPPPIVDSPEGDFYLSNNPGCRAKHPKEDIRMPDLDPVTENLLATSPDYRRLFDEHQDCKKQLEAMRQKSLPSQEDEQEMKRIKLHKLYLKDQMEQMLQREQVLA